MTKMLLLERAVRDIPDMFCAEKTVLKSTHNMELSWISNIQYVVAEQPTTDPPSYALTNVYPIPKL